jgi:hypothetical protein
MKFGKHRGVNIKQIGDTSYLEWILAARAGNQCMNLAEHAAFLIAVRNEIDRRKQAEEDFLKEQERASEEPPRDRRWHRGMYDDAEDAYTYAAYYQNPKPKSYTCAKCCDTGKIALGQFCLDCVKGLTMHASKLQQEAWAKINRLETELHAARGRGASPPPASQRAPNEVSQTGCREALSLARKATARYHPDAGGKDDAGAKFKELNACIDWLEKCVGTLRK